MSKQLLSYFVFFISFSALSQIQNSNSKTYIEDEYSKYFELPRETIYLHFNKSEYVYGEEIWFKGYVYDRRSETPINLTTNVYIDIYNDTGHLIKSKLFLGFNGYLRGNLSIDNDLTSGKYFIRAYTHWMKNFIEDDAYTTELYIINETEVNFNSNLVITSGYDVQFLPESGYALTGIKNKLGVKVINSQGMGVEVLKGNIIENESLQEISTFKTNRFGLGNVSVLYENGKMYTATLELKNGDILKQPLPESQYIGVNFNVQNTSEKKIYISLNKTATTEGDNFKLLIHKNGISKSVNVKFKDELTTNLSISRNSLFEGINILTLFNAQNKPIAERLVYNHKEGNLQQNKIKLVYNRKVKDSLQFSISTPISLNTSFYNLSISVLPKGTESYNHSDNIISNFKLLPYLKGNVEESRYYFNNINRETKYNLDLLLLTQGWSRYAWDNIFNHKPKQTFKFEYGLSLTGKINTNAKSVSLLNLRNSNSQIKRINPDQTFKIDNIFPETNEFINLSFNNQKKSNLNKTFQITHELKYLNTPKTTINIEKIRNHTQTNTSISNPALNTFILDNKVFLDEAFISNNGGLKKESLGRGKSILIEDIDYNNTSIINIIKDNGFIVNQNAENITIVTSKSNNNKSPLVYLNDQPINDLNILKSLKLQLIDEILLDQYALSKDYLSPYSGTISIYTRKFALPTKSELNKPPIYSIKAEKGFAPYIEFYNPKYTFYKTSAYKKHGVIHWFSDVIVENIRKRIKIPNHKQESISFYIEGMSDAGNLISEVIIVNIPEKK